MARIDLRNRAPTVERLPDQRVRVTRTADVVNFSVFTQAEAIADAWLPWGTPDATYPVTLLIKQDITGQHPSGGGMRGDPDISPERHPPLLIRIFEQIDPALETQVGNADVKIADDGTTTVIDESIQFSTGTAIYGVPGFTLAPAPWPTLVLKSEERTDDGTLRRIKRTYISKGFISQVDEFRNFNSLRIRTLVYVNQVPPTPAGFTLVDQDVRNPNGLPIYTYKFAMGVGLIDQRYQQREGGLRVATWLSLGTSFIPAIMQPPGVLLAQDQEWVDGMYKYMVSAMQNSVGGDLTVGTAFAYITKHPFRYPGRAKAYRKDFTANIAANSFIASAYDIFKSPPIEVDLSATVVVSYGTNPGLAVGTATLWNPDTWAAYEAIWQSWNVCPHQRTESLFGYRAINDGVPLNFTAGSAFTGGGSINVSGVNTSCMGDFVYGLSSGHITVFGGPPAPDGFYWTLAIKIDPAFTDFSGNQYFRKTQVIALVPTQTPLPAGI